MGMAENLEPIPNTIDLAVRKELISLLFGSPSVPLINGAAAIITAAVLWRVFPWPVSLAWLIVLLLIVFARLALWFQFKKQGHQSNRTEEWARLYTFFTLVTGCLWGLVALTAFATSQPVYYLFAAFVIGGLAAGGAIRLSPHLPAVYSFIGGSVPPMILALLIPHHLIATAASGLLLIFVVVMILVGRQNHQQFTDYIRMKIEQEHTLAELRQRESDLTTIARLSDMLQSCNSVTDAYPIIAEKAALLFPNATGFLAILDPAATLLSPVAEWGNPPSVPAFPPEECQAMIEDLPHESTPSSHLPSCRHLASARADSTLCLPLHVQARTRGIITLILAPGVAFDDATRQVLHSFADVVQLSLANLHLRESLAEQAFRDPLTGLFNRRYLMETMPRELRRALRRGAPLTIAMLDIDHFKHFNDTYGHDAGDLVLTELAAQFVHDLRAEDIACRYGGEEFLLLLPDCDIDAAFERLTSISITTKSRVRMLRGRTLPGITFSIGLAALTPTLATSESLITAADHALYAAKRMGRDRIECAPDEPTSTAHATPEAFSEKI